MHLRNRGVIMKKKKADKPVKKERKGEGDMAPTAIVQEKTIENNKPLAENGVKKAGRISPAVYERQSKLSQRMMKTFERRLIQKCKEDGMTDKEIREWMREI